MKSTRHSHPYFASDFVREVVKLYQGDLSRLLALTKHQESDWLEFKSATYPRNGVYGENETQGDYAWHVAKACISMANTHGGAILLGVADDGRTVPGLKASDPNGYMERENFDSFCRKVISNAITPSSQMWKCGSGERYEVDVSALSQQIEILHGHYKEESVAVILVKPLMKQQGPLLVHVPNNLQEFLYVRSHGDYGKTEGLYCYNTIRKYWNARNPEIRLFVELKKRMQREESSPVHAELNRIREMIREMKQIDERVLRDIETSILELEAKEFGEEVGGQCRMLLAGMYLLDRESAGAGMNYLKQSWSDVDTHEMVDRLIEDALLLSWTIENVGSIKHAVVFMDTCCEGLWDKEFEATSELEIRLLNRARTVFEDCLQNAECQGQKDLLSYVDRRIMDVRRRRKYLLDKKEEKNAEKSDVLSFIISNV